MIDYHGVLPPNPDNVTFSPEVADIRDKEGMNTLGRFAGAQLIDLSEGHLEEKLDNTYNVVYALYRQLQLLQSDDRETWFLQGVNEVASARMLAAKQAREAVTI